MRYQVNTTRRGKTTLSEPTRDFSAALKQAQQETASAKVITIIADQEGADHPANAGKFFLHSIIK